MQNCKHHTFPRVFILLVAVILAVTALAKLYSLTGTAAMLFDRDPVFGLQFKHLMLASAFVEILVVWCCLSRSVWDGLVLIAWLTSVITTYRAALWFLGWQKPCSCLGNLTDALHISPQLADNVMRGLLAFMLIGSVSLLILHYRQGRAGGPTPNQPTPEPTQA